MFLIVLLFALASADADNGNFIADADDGNFLLDTSGIVPILPAAQVHAVNWQIPVSPNHITINVGDSVLFQWTGMHGVVMFPDATTASNCAVSGANSLSPILNNGGSFSWLANTAGDFYFACPVGNGAHCQAGMHLWVTVVNPVATPLAISGSLGLAWGTGCTLCGASCLTLSTGALGVCNANLNCVVRRFIPPICGTVCPALSCGIAPTCLGSSVLFNPTDATGCPMCPICTATSAILPCIGGACNPLPCCPLVIPQGFSCIDC